MEGKQLDKTVIYLCSVTNVAWLTLSKLSDYDIMAEEKATMEKSSIPANL